MFAPRAQWRAQREGLHPHLTYNMHMTSRVNNAVKFQVSSFKFKFINEQQQKAIFFVEKHIWDNVKKKKWDLVSLPTPQLQIGENKTAV